MSLTRSFASRWLPRAGDESNGHVCAFIRTLPWVEPGMAPGGRTDALALAAIFDGSSQANWFLPAVETSAARGTLLPSRPSASTSASLVTPATLIRVGANGLVGS